MTSSSSRLLSVLTATQALASSAMPISFIAGTLAAVAMAGGDPHFAGVPGFVSLVFASGASFLAGRRLSRTGFRPVLRLGALLGSLGFVVAALGAHLHALPLFLPAFSLVGAGIGLLGFIRFAAAEGAPPERRARAIGTVVLGSTLGAISGPWLVTLGEGAFRSANLPSALGPWAVGFVLFVLCFLFTTRLPAITRSSSSTSSSPDAEASPRLLSLARNPRVATALLAGVAAQLAMVLVMAITPLQMKSCHYGVGEISLVLSAHFLGMFGMSWVSGWIADRTGRPRSIALGGLVLISACLLAPHAHGVTSLVGALFLLGWGWSLCFLGASATLSEGLPPRERGRVQGLNEALVNLASGLASLGSGLGFHRFGFEGLAWIGLGVAILPLSALLIKATQKD